MGINLKEVHANTTSDEWSERYDDLFCDMNTVISEVMDKNKRLKRQSWVLTGIAVGMMIIATKRTLKKKGE